jgi:hypothetical protein
MICEKSTLEEVMAKRFTDSEKWNHGWFRKLKPEMKCVWFFILDRCDHAGIYIHDIEAMCFNVGAEITTEEFETVFGDKLQKFDSDKYHIKAFIEFQYGELSETNNAHKSVISKLKKLAPQEPLKSPTSGAQDKEEDKDKVKDIISCWNNLDFKTSTGEVRKLPQVLKATDSRKNKIKTRLSEPQFKYQEIFKLCIENDFLNGKNNRGWKLDFDWIVENDTNYIKVLEGRYSGGNKENELDQFKKQFGGV